MIFIFTAKRGFEKKYKKPLNVYRSSIEFNQPALKAA